MQFSQLCWSVAHRMHRRAPAMHATESGIRDQKRSETRLSSLSPPSGLHALAVGRCRCPRPLWALCSRCCVLLFAGRQSGLGSCICTASPNRTERSHICAPFWQPTRTIAHHTRTPVPVHCPRAGRAGVRDDAGDFGVAMRRSRTIEAKFSVRRWLTHLQTRCAPHTPNSRSRLARPHGALIVSFTRARAL
jgi:hypothetical protein